MFGTARACSTGRDGSASMRFGELHKKGTDGKMHKEELDKWKEGKIARIRESTRLEKTSEIIKSSQKSECVTPTRERKMFQKAESDLDYIQHKVEYEIRKSLPDDSAAEENPVAVLEELAVVKSRFKTLCMKLDKISTEQNESMAAIHAAVENTMKIVQTLQQQTDLEHLPLSEEQTAAQQLTCQTVKEVESLVEELFF